MLLEETALRKGICGGACSGVCAMRIPSPAALVLRVAAIKNAGQ